MKLPLLNIDGTKSTSIEISDKLVKLKVNYKLIKFVIDCAVSFFDEKKFEEKINYNSQEWLEALDLRISKIKKTNQYLLI